MRLKVRLPDGKSLELPSAASTAEAAARIGERLGRDALAGLVTHNGHREIIDLHRPLPGDCDLSVLTARDDNPDSLMLLRHSTAHVMAEAICCLFPETKLVYGPALEDGFYYDIDLPRSLTPDDFSRIEKEMSRIVQENRPFRRVEMGRAAAMQKVRQEGNRYKIENLERAEGETISFYVTGERVGEDFEDLCRGPHIPSTGLIKAFAIRQVSRSHYRGDVNDQPLQRVYGTAFFKKSSLTEYLAQLEEAKRRDHRVLGKEHDLFHISDRVGSGLPLWLPKGAVIRAELQNYLTEEMVKLGYEFVSTPHIGQLGLYRRSGHYPYYEDSQYPAMFETARGKALQSALQLAKNVKTRPESEQPAGVEAVRSLMASIQQAWGLSEPVDADASLDSIMEAIRGALAREPGYLLRPMNCPHHIEIYASRPRSYRDLPVRLAEYGMVYRYEQSGEIVGLTRVRGFTVDDAHLFCTPEQLATELRTTLQLTRRVLETLGMTDYRVRLGMRDPTSDKYVGSVENWAKAEAAIRSAAEQSGVSFTQELGEAAFYGPKIDFIVKDCLKRSWQLGTVQVDYNLPERFELTYVGADNTPHVPVMIHRAPLGSLERFIGILIEHFAGAFPLWLAPRQVAVATVSEKSEAYGREVCGRLKEGGLRVDLDLASDKIGPKKHRLRAALINYILVVGEKEAAARNVNVNGRDGSSLGNMTLEAFVEACQREIATKGRSCVAAP